MIAAAGLELIPKMGDVEGLRDMTVELMGQHIGCAA
jgi:hypothetical protein